MLRIAWLVALLIIVGPMAAHAQLWSGILASSRAIDWRNAGVPGGIPTRTTICSTLNPGATSAQIGAAIAACPAGQVVFLNAGTYTLSLGIDFGGKSNVTLRGAGPTQTIIRFTGGPACGGLGGHVCVWDGAVNYGGGPQNTASWTAGYAVGTTQITLSSTTNLTVGSVLILDQVDDASDPGTIFVNDVQNVSSISGPGGNNRTTPGGPRNQQQLVKVSAIGGNTVTITPGLYMPNWRSSQSPGAWWSSSMPITGVGIEDMTLDHTAAPGDASGIYFFNSYGSWVKNVKSLTANRNHVWFFTSARNTVRDSYFYGSQNAASQSYGVEWFSSSDNLVENNIFQHITAPIIFQNDVGSVAAYNFTTDDYYTVSPPWMMPGIFMHTAGVSMQLMEGNQGSGFIADAEHGPHAMGTVFRNQFSGLELGKLQQTIPIHIYTYSRYFNIIGNVLGTAGYHTNYEDAYPGGTRGDVSIYALGWGGNEGASGPVPNDASAKITLMRWGNYDVVNNAVRWVSSEVPSGLGQYANPVPASQTLPPSFYLSAKPGWWGTTPWPAIGPDVIGGDIAGVGGFAWRNPARLCYDNTSKTGGILNFDAATCYRRGPAPAAPTGLNVR